MLNMISLENGTDWVEEKKKQIILNHIEGG